MPRQFYIHDNGSTPYLVEIDSEYVAVYINKYEDEYEDSEDGEADYVHYPEFIAPLIKAVQELSAKVKVRGPIVV